MVCWSTRGSSCQHRDFARRLGAVAIPIVLCASVSVLPVGVDSALQLHLLPEAVVSHHARCLDGSPFGFYLEKGTSDPDKWVILMQGGGLCITPVDCAERLKGGEGSSKFWGKTYTSEVDLVSANRTANPFAGWTRVWLRYCSGDTWTGQRTDKVPYDLYFAGHHNLRAALDALLDPARGFGLDRATKLIFTGKSAGGIGTFSSADWVRGRISPKTLMLSVPQAGYFFPNAVDAYEEWVAGVNEPINKFFSEYVVTLEDSYLHRGCVKARTAVGGELAECWDAHIAFNFTRVPTFMLENMWDQLMIEDILLMPGTDAPEAAGFIDYYGRQMRASVAWNRAHNPEYFTGLFQASCFKHTQNLCTASPTAIRGVRFQDALKEWVDHDGKKLVWHQDTCYKYGTCETKCPDLCP